MKNKTQEQILQVGTDLIHRNGYNGVGLNKILEETNVPKGSFYYYFKSKEDLGVKAIDFYGQQSADHLRSFLENKELKPKERILELLNTMKSVYHDQEYQLGCMLANCSLELGAHGQVFSETINKNFNVWEDLFKQVIEEGQLSGNIKNDFPADDLAALVLNSWEGAVVRTKVTKNNKPMDQFISIIEYIM